MEIQISNNNMLTYKEHYKASQENYKKDKGPFAYPRAKLYDFTVREYGPDKYDDLVRIDDGAMSLLGDVSDVAKKRFSDLDSNCYYPDDVDRDKDPMFRIKDVWNIQPLNEFVSFIMPQVEANLFGSYSIVDGLYFYRTIFRPSNPKSSFLWHYDNHAKERIKLLFYLDDVTEKDGPFEYMWNEEDKMALKADTTRVDYRTWTKHHSRVKPKDHKLFTSYGYKPKKMLGGPGTFAMFDNNCVHRANVPEPGHHRDVFVLMCRPYHEKLHPYIDERWTGTNYHVDTNPDPKSKTVVKK